jgi:hypothetical protein
MRLFSESNEMYHISNIVTLNFVLKINFKD